MKNVLRNVCNPSLRYALDGPVLNDLRLHAGATRLNQINRNIHDSIFNQVASIVRLPLRRLEEARQTYIERRRKSSHPLGIWISRGWFPDFIEHRECCDLVRRPTMSYPKSLMRHCRTLKHIANLYGVPLSDLRWIARGYQRKGWMGWRKRWEEKRREQMAKRAAISSEEVQTRRRWRRAQWEVNEAWVANIKAEMSTIKWDPTQEDFQI